MIKVSKDFKRIESPVGHQGGSVMVEYIMAISFCMILIWYAIVGPEPITEKSGDPGTGQAVERIYESPPAYLGLRHALRNKEATFHERLYQP